MKTGNTSFNRSIGCKCMKQFTMTLPRAPSSSAPETKNNEIPEMLEKESRVLKRIRNYKES